MSLCEWIETNCSVLIQKSVRMAGEILCLKWLWPQMRCLFAEHVKLLQALTYVIMLIFVVVSCIEDVIALNYSRLKVSEWDSLSPSP